MARDQSESQKPEVPPSRLIRWDGEASAKPIRVVEEQQDLQDAAQLELWPEQPKPKVVISGLMGWEAQPAEKPTLHNSTVSRVRPKLEVNVSSDDCCASCGMASYLRCYDHLYDGTIIRCIWCGATWSVEERHKTRTTLEALSRRPQSVARETITVKVRS
jgi:hypothetical protein